MHMRRPIPDDVRRFVLTSVPSVPFLEAMLLMRAHSKVCWEPAELARRLYVAPGLGEELLAQLSGTGFAVAGEKPGTWCWNDSHAMASIIDELAGVYAENVVGIAELIHSRQRRAQQFADAFVLRKKEE
jgi:hypothetical protein